MPTTTSSATRSGHRRKAYDELIATAGFPKKRKRLAHAVACRREAGGDLPGLPQQGARAGFPEVPDGGGEPASLRRERTRPLVSSDQDSQKSVFWQADRQRKSIYDQFMAGTVLFEFTWNYRFATLNSENVWAKAMHRVVNDKVPVDKAVDELIARIKEVAG